MKRRRYMKKLIAQKLIGILILLVCAVCICVASAGSTIKDRECSIILLLAPLGIYLLCTHRIWIY